jgi:hypothetical protein
MWKIYICAAAHDNRTRAHALFKSLYVLFLKETLYLKACNALGIITTSTTQIFPLKFKPHGTLFGLIASKPRTINLILIPSKYHHKTSTCWSHMFKTIYSSSINIRKFVPKLNHQFTIHTQIHLAKSRDEIEFKAISLWFNILGVWEYI